jgi:protein-S-isoprenylcysteine O-methyltransferase Ste14
MNDLNKKAWRGIVFLALVMGLLLFVPAGTIRYWQAWGYLTVYFSSSLLVTIYLMRNNPALLAKRLRAGPRAEKEATQKIIMALASTAFVALLIVPGLDHRFGWSRVPTFVVLAANLMVAVGLYIIFIVYKASPFTSATIQVEKDQKVISTGPYSIVRHPMYSGGLVMLLGTPPALGS